MLTIKDLIRSFKKRDRRALARILTLVESRSPERVELLKEIFPLTGQAYCIGITGAPGVGKSSLVNSLTGVLRREDLQVGILAIDPSSPFSGGAIFGDRIRMQNHTLDSGVYIRSMGSRGSLGGLSLATRDAARVLDAFGYDLILIETVGVGQAELDVMDVADSVVVALIPGAGDSIQAIKAGIMEIGDIFAINKCDLDGADKTAREVRALLEMSDNSAWTPPVIRTSSETGEGFNMLWQSLLYHKEFLASSSLKERKREAALVREVQDIIAMSLKEEISYYLIENKMIERASQGDEDPYSLALKVKEQLFKKRG